MKSLTQNKYHGWIILNKPYGISSNKALQKVRSAFDKSKAGHVGTLDPLASGVLPIALGEATKLIPFLEKSEKSYEFEVTWGERRATDDFEGEIIATSKKRPSQSEIEEALSHFIGEIDQTPPSYSAIKIYGKAAYHYARQNQPVVLKSRKVFIKSLVLENPISCNQARFRLVCGAGVYVRSLARDLAFFLGTEGYISYLSRTKVGSWEIDQAIGLQKILEMQSHSELQRVVHSMGAVLDDILVVVLDDGLCGRLLEGQSVPFHVESLSASIESVVLCKNTAGILCGILSYKNGLLIPRRMFNYLT